MRNPHDDTLGATSSPLAGGTDGAPGGALRSDTRASARKSSDPIRRCILIGDRAPQAALVRLALGPDGSVLPDVRAKAPGRGAWIGVTKAELETAIAKGKLKGALARAFKTGPIGIPDDLPQKVETALERAALDRLGLESRSGGLFSGAEKIETAARSGKLHLLLHACDAGADGNRKLDQAWRVGNDEEGSDRRGLVLPVPRTILAVALGRQNVVHIGLTDPDAARRVRETLDRWLHFIGPDPILPPCETASQGASASQEDGDDLTTDLADDSYEEFE
ncbi:DUF448 domain-containing protein [Sphingomonas qilianensis]|uniref:DUF448 domain-containing protein n=1 Tax=Sphingomonas qilianensis TaxID=1736690 RepID=A0ABU9XT03_9SPHN